MTTTQVLQVNLIVELSDQLMKPSEQQLHKTNTPKLTSLNRHTLHQSRSLATQTEQI